MAPSCSEKQPGLFDHLDGIDSAGVFYFPKTATTQADQISAIEITLTHLNTLNQIFDKYKVTVAAASKYAGAVVFVARFESMLKAERQKLLDISAPAQESMRDSMPVENGSAR